MPAKPKTLHQTGGLPFLTAAAVAYLKVGSATPALLSAPALVGRRLLRGGLQIRGVNVARDVILRLGLRQQWLGLWSGSLAMAGCPLPPTC